MDFNKETPIKSSSEDLLNRSEFAHDLADAILNYHDLESLTIGLNGEWGSGKSSIINMMKEKINYEHVMLIEFNPWYFSTQDNLYQQFFNLMISEIEKKKYGNKNWFQKKESQLKVQWKKASKIENKPETLKDYFKTNRSILKRIKRKIGRIKNYPKYCYAKIHILFSFEDSDILLKYFNHIKSNSSINLKKFDLGYSYNFEEIGKEYNYLSLLKEKCNIYFKHLSFKFIIVIDDLDRMSGEEIKQLLTLVKSIADFKNFIYILSFDRKVVSNLISENYGEAYLEKIVNVSLDVPIITEDEMKNLLKNELKGVSKKLNIILNENRLNRMLIHTDYKNSDHYGIIKYFKTVRDVKRLINTLEFNIGPIAKEVNFEDFIVITTLQLFKPEIFRQIKINESLLVIYTIPQESYLNKPETLKKEKEEFEKIVNNDENIKHILQSIFPKMEFIYRTNFLSNDSDIYDSELRVCSKNHFKTYFKLNPTVKEITEYEITTTIDIINSKNEAEIKKQFDTLLELDKLNLFFKYVPNRMKYVTEYEFFLNLIFNLNTYVTESTFHYSEHELKNICLQLIMKIDKSNRFSLLKEEFENSQKVEFMYILLKEIERNYSPSQNRFEFSEIEIETLKNILKNKYLTFLANYPKNPKYNLTYHLEIGEYLNIKNENKEFINRLITSNDGLNMFLKSLLDHHMNSFNESEIRNINYFYDMELLKERIDENYDELKDNILVKKFLKDYEIYSKQKK